MNIENLHLLVGGLQYLENMKNIPEIEWPSAEEILVAVSSFSLPFEFWNEIFTNINAERDLLKQYLAINDEEYDILCPENEPEKTLSKFLMNVEYLKNFLNVK